jgi:polysaccharide biosynthesis/export protein
MQLEGATRRTPTPGSFAAACLGAAMSVACAHSQPFVWIDSVPEGVANPPAVYVIGPGDVLAIRVWEQDGMSTRARVREDGKISFPLVDDLQAGGNTPTQLARGIEETLRTKRLLNNPRVTVNVEEPRPTSVTVFGEVSHPGSFPLASGTGLLQALASAGGLTEFAGSDRIYVLRPGLPWPRIRFRYQDLLQPGNRAADFRLMSGDVIIVE